MGCSHGNPSAAPDLQSFPVRVCLDRCCCWMPISKALAGSLTSLLPLSCQVPAPPCSQGLSWAPRSVPTGTPRVFGVWCLGKCENSPQHFSGTDGFYSDAKINR